MIELLAKIDTPGIVEHSCLIKGKDILATSFPAEYKNQQTIGKQAFTYVFTNVSKAHTRHNEAHLEMGKHRLSGFLLKPSVILICLSNKDSNINMLRKHILEIKSKLFQKKAR